MASENNLISSIMHRWISATANQALGGRVDFSDSRIKDWCLPHTVYINKQAILHHACLHADGWRPARGSTQQQHPVAHAQGRCPCPSHAASPKLSSTAELKNSYTLVPMWRHVHSVVQHYALSLAVLTGAARWGTTHRWRISASVPDISGSPVQHQPGLHHLRT